MAKTIHCDNCGASMNADSDNAMAFCPYCGAALKQDETIYDYARFKAKHDEQVRKTVSAEKREDDRRTVKGAIIVFASLIALCALVIVIVRANKGSADARLEQLTTEVQQLIIDGNYDEAMVKVQGIRVEKDGWFDERYSRWENQRKDLIRLIEQKQRESN